jgi:hypothetical protein
MFMKKLYLALVALVAFATTASAGHKNLYKQDFETATSPAIAGWTSPNLAGGMSIQSDADGTYFQFSLGNNNNRNAVLNFNYGKGADETIYDGVDVKEYTIKFVWSLAANPNNGGNAANSKNVQFSTELAVLTPSVATSDVEGWKITKSINNGQYAKNDSLRLFALTQLKGAYSETNTYWADNTDVTNYAFDFYINGDENNKVTLAEGGWYEISITVNTVDRTTEYEIYDMIAKDVIAKGNSTIPAYASVWADKLNVLLGRYNSVAQLDDIKVQAHTDTDIANDPTIALTGVDQKKRTYKIFFEDTEGEILNVKGTEGNTIQEVKSPYEYTTETSGTLEAWTELGRGESNHVKVDVVAEVIKLPAAAIDITKVNAGYVKTLKMTVDNAEVPTQPQITLTWEYSNGDKSTGEVLSGELYNASEKGTLTVTTHAYGFGETTSTFENNTEFAVDKTIDFQHMTEADLTAKGFAEIEELRIDKMSGEGNWTARSYLYYNIETGETKDDGTPVVEKHVVYGPTTNAEAEGIRRFYLKPSTLTKTVATTIFAPFYTWYTGQADPAVADGSDVAGLKMNYGIGLINTGTKTDDGTSINYANGIVGIDGLTDNDYYIAYIISNYGSTSKHPTYPAGTTEAEGKALYKAENLGDGDNVQVLRGTETYSLYRIDTAIARIDIFKAVADPTGIETLPYNQIVSDHNAPIYNLNGVQVNPNALQKGIYIKQGKKFIVK